MKIFSLVFWSNENFKICFWNFLTFSESEIQHWSPLEFFVKVWLASQVCKMSKLRKTLKSKNKQTYTNSNYYLTSSAYIQVDSFQKVSGGVHHLMKKMDRFSTHVQFLFKFFDKIRKFLKIFNLYSSCFLRRQQNWWNFHRRFDT